MRNIQFTLACLASLAAASTELDWTQTAEENYERLFSMCDTGTDDFISRQEHRICAEAMQEEGTTVDAVDMYMNFVHYDLNGDESISRDEAKFVVSQTMNPPADSWTFSEVFNYIDARTVDQEIDWEEWLAVWEGLFNDWDAMELRRIFKYADSDESGTLSWSEAEAEHENHDDFQRKFEAVAGSDDFIELAEWIAEPIFSASTASDASIREKFVKYDLNGDGKLHFMELYTNERARQYRWANFQSFWDAFETNGQQFFTTAEGIKGVQLLNPDITEAEAEALVASYDMSGNGEIHALDLWAKQTRDWEGQWDAENAEWNSNIAFYPHWVQYDRNLDEIATWEEIRAAREILEDETATRSFYDWYMQSSPAEVSNLDDTSTGMTVTTYEDGSTRTWSYVSGVKMNEDGTVFAEGIQYELAMARWNEDNESVAEFNRIWSLVDSNNDGQVSKDDLYASQGLIPDFEATDVELFWQQCMLNASSDVCSYSAACKSALYQTPWMCEDETETAEVDEYTKWREEFYSETIGMYDANGDGMLDESEVITAASMDYNWPIATEVMAWNDLDQDGFITETELYAQNWLIKAMEEGAEKAWMQIDPTFEGAVTVDWASLMTNAYLVQEITGKTLTTDFQAMDLNYDGMISAQEACLYADYDYPYPSRCYLLPNEVATTDDSTTTTDPAVAETQEYLDFLVGWYKVDRDLDGIMQKDDLYYIRSSTLFTSDQIDQEYSYLSGGVSPVPDTLNRDDVYPIILQHSMMQDSFQNWFNTTDYGQDGYLNSTELASTSNRNTNVTSTSGADVSEIEACLMWFSDYENSCYGYESLDTDVASEDFIKGWYEVDTDFDNSVTRDQFVAYFSQDGLTTEMAGEMFDAYFPSMTTVDFSAAVTKNTEVDEKMTLLHTIYAIINNSTYADFDVTDVENVYNELLGTGIIDAAVDFTGATWYDSIGLADYTKATFHEVCSFIVDEYQCTQQEYEVEQETEAAAVADSIYDGIRGSSIIQWYRIDTDKDEVIVEADLRAARSASAYTDDSVTAEFNHYDTNLDGIVTQEEAWEVRKHDYDAMSWWDAASDWMYEYSEGQWNGTEPVNTWNNDYNYNITTLSPFTFTVLDTNQDGYVSKSEACSYVMGDASNICFEVEDTTYDWQMSNLQQYWYNFDTDMDETLSADEFAAFWIKENDDWMTTDEAIAEMALMDTDSRGNVTFDQVLTFIKEQSQIEEAWSTFWQTLDTTWSYQLNQTTTEEAWASIDITTYSNWTLSSDDAISWFTRMDLDQNGIVEKQEACAVANGRMCNNWFNQNTEYLEWPADKNFDGYVSESEYSRYMNGTNASINTVMYNDWLMSGLDAGVELSWNTIQQRQSLVNETFTSWANLVDQEWLANGNVTEYSSYAANSSSFYNSTEPTKIPVDTMVNTYSYTTASDWDLDQDLMISDKEFCIGTIGNELPCMDMIDLDIKYWADTDADDQVSWDEYWTIAQQEGDAENSAQLDFDLYDMNNDGFVVRDEIDEYETYMNDAMNSTTSFNTTEFGNVTALFDQDGDMALNRAEFNEAVNMVLLFTDNAQLDATTEETFFNAAAANKDAMDSIDATIFLRKILGTGLKAYIDEL